MNVEVFPGDQEFDPGDQLHLVRFPIYITHDVPDPDVDSIAGFRIPLCYTHSNPSKYCSLSFYWNRTTFSGGSSARSIFRDLVRAPGDTIFNWMMDLYQQDPSVPWANIILYVKTGGTNPDSMNYWWLALVPNVEPYMGTVSKALIATMTFRVQDTMSICLDSCFWPPWGSLLWALMGGEKSYIPRDNMPYCFSLSLRTPSIMSITDVANDQGKQVRVKWNRCRHDTVDSLYTITEYSLWRRIDQDKSNNQSHELWLSQAETFGKGRVYPPGDWDFIKTVPARGESVYNTVCPTLRDSSETGGMHWSVFFVSAMTSDPLVYFDSYPDSGYSLDNIPPLPIHDLEVNPISWFTLEWTVPGEYVGEHPISTYDIRYNTVPVGADPQAWWDTSHTCSGEGFFNFIVGAEDSIKVAKESWCHFHSYFAIKGLDERPNASEISNFYHFICGDANGDSVGPNLGDIVYLIAYVFKGGPPPRPLARGDCNNDGIGPNLNDIVYLINYVFKSGPLPCSHNP